MLKEHKSEIERWLRNPNEPDIWVKGGMIDDNKWVKLGFEDCGWYEEHYYVVDDEQAELRKLQIDEPDTNFECWNNITKRWSEVDPLWIPKMKYRVKQEFNYPIFKVCNKGTDKELIVKFTDLNSNEVVFVMPELGFTIGATFDNCLAHTDNYWEDVLYNPERKLYDKQPVICWDDNMEAIKIIGFYDVKNDNVFDFEGCRDGVEYDNYTPYPHPDDKFIIEMYKKLEE